MNIRRGSQDHHRHPPCCSDRRRRRHEDATPRRSDTKIIPRYRSLASIAALAIASLTVTSYGSAPVLVAAAAPVPTKGTGTPLVSDSFSNIVRQIEMTRRLEATAEDDHDDHDHGEVSVAKEDSHEGHDHGDHGGDDHDNLFVAEEDDHGDHDGHDHDEVSVSASAADEDSHEGHDHGDHDGHDHAAVAVAEEDSHEGHDHGDHDGHDHGSVSAAEEDNHEGHDHADHDGHDHGDGEFVTSANENSSEKLLWGPVIGACLIVNLATLIGVLMVIMTAIQRGFLKRQGKDVSDAALGVGHGKLFDICVPAFSVGALLATAVFLIFPEALHLIEGAHADHGEEEDSHEGHDHRHLQEDSHEGHDDSSESENAAKFGCAILGGFLLPMFFAIFFHHTDHTETADDTNESDNDCDTCNHGDVEGGVADTAVMLDSSKNSAHGVPLKESREQEPATINKQLCSSILLGDGFHNFGDGVFIAAAFKSCSTGTAISIVLVTLFHELAQELADFVFLTRYAGLSIIMATVLNFLSGLTVCLGGIVFLAANPTDQATGIILAMAGGVYFYIAGCEAIPRIENATKGRIDRVWALLSVILGTIPIGLILLNHQHC